MAFGLLRRDLVTSLAASAGRVHCLPMKLQMKVPGNLAVRTGCAFVVLATTACGGSEEGVPVSSAVVRIALTATSTDEGRVAVRSESAELSVEELGLSLHVIEIVPCAPDSAAIAQHDYPVDLAVEPPAQALFESGVSEYCGILFDVAPSTAADPVALEDLSVLVRGTRSDGVPFVIRSEFRLTTDLSSSTGEPFGTGHLALGFDLARWFEGVDVESASLTDGVATIDIASNTDILQGFEANTLSATALYADADRDGVLDLDELTAIATAP
jgi:hypothetical protein